MDNESHTTPSLVDKPVVRNKAMQHLESLKHQNSVNDFAFLVQHVVMCLLTDIPGVPAMGWVKDHTQFKNEAGVWSYQFDWNAPNKNHIPEFGLGEIIGDLAAVPLTLAAQHFAPDIMNALRGPLEAMFGVFYRDSAEQAADRWAQYYDIGCGTPEHYEYKEAHCRKELDHLPQMLVWTVSSMLAGALAQKHLLPALTDGKIGNDDAIAKIFIDSIAGKVVTALAANGMRLAAPQTTDYLEHELSEVVQNLTAPQNTNHHKERTSPDSTITEAVSYEQRISDVQPQKAL